MDVLKYTKGIVPIPFELRPGLKGHPCPFALTGLRRPSRSSPISYKKRNSTLCYSIKFYTGDGTSCQIPAPPTSFQADSVRFYPNTTCSMLRASHLIFSSPIHIGNLQSKLLRFPVR